MDYAWQKCDVSLFQKINYNIDVIVLVICYCMGHFVPGSMYKNGLHHHDGVILFVVQYWFKIQYSCNKKNNINTFYIWIFSFTTMLVFVIPYSLV